MKKEKQQQEETTYQIIESENSPFNILKQDEKFHIICGNTLASQQIFETLEETLEHIEKLDWQMIGTLIIKIIENHEKTNEIEKIINKAKN